jgi:hypothetical protein
MSKKTYQNREKQQPRSLPQPRRYLPPDRNTDVLEQQSEDKFHILFTPLFCFLSEST